MEHIRGFEIVSGFEGRAILPVRGTKFSAGYDLCNVREVVVWENEVVKVETGIKVYMPKNEFFQISIRSSLASMGIILANGVGIIDSDYYNNEKNEGHIILLLAALNYRRILKAGERVAQGIFLPYFASDEATDGMEIRRGGLGSTGI